MKTSHLALNINRSLYKNWFVFIMGAAILNSTVLSGAGVFLVLLYIFIFLKKRVKLYKYLTLSLFIIAMITVIIMMVTSGQESSAKVMLLKQSMNFLLFLSLLNLTEYNNPEISVSNYVFVLVHILMLPIGIGLTGYGGHAAGLDNINFGYKGLFTSGNELNFYLLTLILMSKSLRVKPILKGICVLLCGIAGALTLSKVGFGLALLSVLWVLFTSDIKKRHRALFAIFLAFVVTKYIAPFLIIFVERQIFFYERYQSFSFLMSGRLERSGDVEIASSLWSVLFGNLFVNYQNFEIDFINIFNLYGIFLGLVIIMTVFYSLSPLRWIISIPFLILSNLSGHAFFYNGVTICLFILRNSSQYRKTDEG